MAEAVFLRQLEDQKCAVSSAGIAALAHYPADPAAQEVMAEHGFDISGHRARQATRDILVRSDLILALDQTHSDWIRNRFPELLGRVQKLGRWRENIDIPDPYRQPKRAFDEAYEMIDRCIQDWASRIRLI